MGDFLLFAGSKWYPSGGGFDFLGRFATTEEARRALPSPWEVESGWGCAWAHIFDLATGLVVAAWTCTYAAPGESVWVPVDRPPYR